MSVLTVFATVLSLLIMAVPGFLLQKFKLLPEKAETVLSNLVLYGLQPFLLFMCFQNENIVFSGQVVVNMLIVLGLIFVVHFLLYGISLLFTRGKNDLAKKRCVRYATVFSNCGFMGIPFLQMLFSGDANAGEIMVYVAAALIVFNFLNWTLGVYIMTGDFKEMSLKKVVLNPVIIALVLGIISFFACRGSLLGVFTDKSTTGYMIVEKVLNSFSFLGNAVTPLSMIVIGMKLARIEFKKLFVEKWAYVTCGLKLIIASFVAILLVAFLPVSNLVKYAVFFLMSMPSATSTVLFAVRFNGDSEFSSVAVSLSTVLSVVSIPLMYLVINGLFGIVIAV